MSELTMHNISNIRVTHKHKLRKGVMSLTLEFVSSRECECECSLHEHNTQVVVIFAQSERAIKQVNAIHELLSKEL